MSASRALQSHPLARARAAKPVINRIPAATDTLVAALWNAERIPLLRFVAQEGPVSVRAVCREFPAVNVSQVYKTAHALRRWGWLLIDAGPVRFRLAPSAVPHFRRVLDQLRPDSVPAVERDDLALRFEVEALVGTAARLRPAKGGPSQLRLLLQDLEGERHG